ncbi:P-type conjugative transfer protein VirB9 [Legionella geestiana]|uniref:P-type conjugative transfer protein VirB9 n=1 Tax=Legionella geestiana TaxID=45065 RepID=UPI001093005A|nr:P-type conjugative transfer protein VirB9 [Legionella geestiana]QDQ40256.1 P-type conjugative transfer protein VirB9 [Legionella geestiana]
MYKSALLFCAASVLTTAATASQTPVPYPKDERIKMVTYQQNNVIPVHGVIFTTTQIIFGERETVLDVEGGDSDGWIATYHKNLPNMIFIKPTMLDSNSNMTVVTNRHNYYFHVTSNKTVQEIGHRQTYALKFTYPEEEREKLNARLKASKEKRDTVQKTARDPKTYNWAYSFSGSKEIMPSRVFDDGTFTYFELRKDQPVPAVFVVDNKQGKESVVNTRQQGDYLVVLRTAPQFTLRNGQKAVASVFNQPLIAAIRQGRR